MTRPVAFAGLLLASSLTAAQAQDRPEDGLGGPPRRSDYARNLVNPQPTPTREARPATRQARPADSGWVTQTQTHHPAGGARGLSGAVLMEAPGTGSRRFPVGTFDRMWKAFPTGTSDEAKRKVGGGAGGDWVTNTCAIRLSHVLNQIGEKIDRNHRLPDGEKVNTTYGRDKSRYIFRVKELHAYLTQKYGEPEVVVVNPGDGGPVPSEILGQKGIIMFKVDVWDDATGHVDLWDGSRSAGKSYFHVAREVYLWKVD